MSFAKIQAGTTSYSLPFIATNSSGGGGYSGLVFNTSGLAAQYRRELQSSWTTITLANMTLGTWTSGGMVADGSLTGSYVLCVPNAAIGAGDASRWVEIQLYGAAGMANVYMFVELDGFDYATGQLPATGLDLVLTEGSVNLTQAVALILDGVLGVLSGVPSSGSGAISVKDPTGNHTRATITVDGNGNRTACTLTPPSE